MLVSMAALSCFLEQPCYVGYLWSADGYIFMGSSAIHRELLTIKVKDMLGEGKVLEP